MLANPHKSQRQNPKTVGINELEFDESETHLGQFSKKKLHNFEERWTKSSFSPKNWAIIDYRYQGESSP